MIHKNEEDWKNEGFRYHYQCKRVFNRAVHNVKNEALLPKNCVLPWKHFIVDSNQCLFCQRMLEERLHDIMQYSKDLELNTRFRECL